MLAKVLLVFVCNCKRLKPAMLCPFPPPHIRIRCKPPRQRPGCDRHCGTIGAVSGWRRRRDSSHRCIMPRCSLWSTWTCARVRRCGSGGCWKTIFLSCRGVFQCPSSYYSNGWSPFPPFFKSSNICYSCFESTNIK